MSHSLRELSGLKNCAIHRTAETSGVASNSLLFQPTFQSITKCLACIKDSLLFSQTHTRKGSKREKGQKMSHNDCTCCFNIKVSIRLREGQRCFWQLATLHRKQISHPPPHPLAERSTHYTNLFHFCLAPDEENLLKRALLALTIYCILAFCFIS